MRIERLDRWTKDCEVGRAAVVRFDAVEVTFRIDRMDARGIEMICVDAKNYPEWQGTHLAIRIIPEGNGTQPFVAAR